MKKAIWITAALLLLVVSIWAMIGRTDPKPHEDSVLPSLRNQNQNDTQNEAQTKAEEPEPDSREDLPPGKTAGTYPAGIAVFKEITDNGYTGTVEEWLAALVGENYRDETKTAYSMAKEKGYRGSYEDWIRTLTGQTPTDQTKTAYQVVRESGRTESLVSWLGTLVDDPSSLGRSSDERATEYERACQNGFQGTFIEWLVSLVGLN